MSPRIVHELLLLILITGKKDGPAFLVPSRGYDGTTVDRKLIARLALYEAHNHRVEGSLVHIHAGHRTEATKLLPERGGRLTMSRVRSPVATAWRYSQIA